MFKRPSISAQQKIDLYKEAIKPVICESQQDIINVLKNLLDQPDNKEVQFDVEMKWADRTGAGSDNIKGISRDTSLYSILLEGLEQIRARIKVTANLEQMIKAAEDEGEDLPSSKNFLWNVDEQRFKVDELIEKRLGAKRSQDKVRWKVREGVYEFDAFQKKLYKIDELVS
jgi:hypothetical protein